jgi:hypothetical protein
MQLSPHTKDEWIGFVLLPAKVFFVAFVLMTFTQHPSYEFRSPAVWQYISPCLYLSGPFLLFGALVQSIFCRRGSATQTLLFLGIVSAYAMFGPGFLLITLVIWIFWRSSRLIRPPAPTSVEPIECLDCHAVIPVGESRCPHCGWTFKA